MIKGLHHDQRPDTREEDRARQDKESDPARSVARALNHVILSEAKDLEFRISRSFAVSAAQDDVGHEGAKSRIEVARRRTQKANSPSTS